MLQCHNFTEFYMRYRTYIRWGCVRTYIVYTVYNSPFPCQLHTFTKIFLSDPNFPCFYAEYMGVRQEWGWWSSNADIFLCQNRLAILANLGRWNRPPRHSLQDLLWRKLQSMKMQLLILNIWTDPWRSCWREDQGSDTDFWSDSVRGHWSQIPLTTETIL